MTVSLRRGKPDALGFFPFKYQLVPICIQKDIDGMHRAAAERGEEEEGLFGVWCFDVGFLFVLELSLNCQFVVFPLNRPVVWLSFDACHLVREGTSSQQLQALVQVPAMPEILQNRNSLL